MRKINIGTKDQTEVIAIDENTYIINYVNGDHSNPMATIRFNDESENLNGVFVNDLLAVCIDRLGGECADKAMLKRLGVFSENKKAGKTTKRKTK